MNGTDYIPAALRTKGDVYHGDGITQASILGALEDAVDAMKPLDQLKKKLFYNKPSDIFGNETTVYDIMYRDREAELKFKSLDPDLVHGVLGVATESQELLELLIEAGTEELDPVNLVDEIGDVLWYVAILLNHLQVSFDEVMALNIAKLKRRYPERFTEALAISNR